MTFRIDGISSGLDTSALIEQLMQIERQPLVQLKNKKTIIDLKKELLSEISSSLSTLQSKVINLVKKNTWNKVVSSSSNENVVTVITDSDSIVGTYKFTDVVLATATTLSSAELVPGAAEAAVVSSTSAVDASSDTKGTFQEFATANGATINDGSITINGFSFSIDADKTTIDEFMNQVNASSAGVMMTYDSSTYKFEITTKEKGSDAVITLSDTTGFLNAANIPADTVRGSGTVNTSGKLTEAETGISGLASDGGTYYFKINGYAFSFSENNSFNDIIDTVNSSGAGVNMIYDSSTDKIIVSSKETGPTNIEFEEIQGNFLQTTGLLDATATPGVSASFNLNGVAMTRDSNEFELNGITFILKDSGNATVTVEKDIDGIYNSIKEFVDQYNSTVELLNTRISEKKVENATTESLMRKGLLRGDSTVISIRSQLREIVTSNVIGLTSIYDSLMEIGITTTEDDFGKSGLLEIDESKLKTTLKDNIDAVRKLFFEDSDDDDTVDDGEIGVMAALYNKIDSFINSSTTSFNGITFRVGIIPMRLDSMENLIDSYDDQITAYEERLEMIEARYWRQFNAMEQVLSQLQNQSSWLTNQLNSFPSST